jgi:hypothetical protein
MFQSKLKLKSMFDNQYKKFNRKDFQPSQNATAGTAGQALQQSSGQAMLIFVLVLGATVLSVTAIAGYVTLQKLRASSDVVDSAKAIYAADSGVEWCFYNKFSTTNGTSTFDCTTSDVNPGPTFSNNLSGNTVDVSVSEGGVAPNTIVKSIGHSGRSYRAFGIFLDQFNP